MKLSVITINYNNRQGLQQTIKSVVNQTFRDFEYIIIDGSSTDGSVEIIKDNKKYIDYWVSEKDNGVYHAMNKGVAAAKGEYLLMLNSGDILINTDILYDVFSKNINAEILYGDIEWRFKNRFQCYYTLPDKIDVSFFLKKSLAHQASFIKRGAHEITGYYDEKMKVSGDWKFFILAAKHNLAFQHLPLVISAGDSEGMSWSAVNYYTIRRERLQVVKRHFPDLLESFKTVIKKDTPSFINKLRILKKIVLHKLTFNHSGKFE